MYAPTCGKLYTTPYYFTLGCGQPNANCYTTICARNATEAAEEMFRRYGNKWSMQYTSAEEAGVEKWNLKLI